MQTNTVSYSTRHSVTPWVIQILISQLSQYIGIEIKSTGLYNLYLGKLHKSEKFCSPNHGALQNKTRTANSPDPFKQALIISNQ